MDLETAKQLSERSIKFVANAGLRVLDLKRGYVKCSMPLAGNENHLGSMYAGALFTLAEIPGGTLFLSSFDTERYFAVVKELQLRFVRQAKSDVYVEYTLDEGRLAEIESEAAGRGKCDFTLEGKLYGEDGTVVAESHGLYQIRMLKTANK